MNFTIDIDLETIASLAGLHISDSQRMHLQEDVQTMMAFVTQLKAIDTTDIAPLHHPLDLYQPLRPDYPDTGNKIKQLAAIAPVFDDGLYQVPKVIDTEYK